MRIVAVATSAQTPANILYVQGTQLFKEVRAVLCVFFFLFFFFIKFQRNFIFDMNMDSLVFFFTGALVLFLRYQSFMKKLIFWHIQCYSFQ